MRFFWIFLIVVVIGFIAAPEETQVGMTHLADGIRAFFDSLDLH